MGILPVICRVNEVMSGEPLCHLSHGKKCQVVSPCWLQGREADREVRVGTNRLGCLVLAHRVAGRLGILWLCSPRGW